MTAPNDPPESPADEVELPDGQRFGVPERSDGPDTGGLEPGFEGPAGIVIEPQASSPYEEDEPEGTIPPCPLWAMKDQRHTQLGQIVGFPAERIREAFGSADSTVYVIDDGHRHVMVGRHVGSVADGSQYGLVGRASLDVYDALRGHEIEPTNAFDEASNLVLTGTDIDERDLASRVFVVQYYGSLADVPEEYLPGHPEISFDEPLIQTDL